MTPPPSDHFNGKTYFYPGDPSGGRGLADVLRWKLTSRAARWPREVPLAPHPAPPAPRGREIVATWIGHSTFLLQTPGGNFLTDPVFSARASPVAWAGPRRAHAPGLPLAALPKIDAVLLSHDHYDHCDLASLAQLARLHAPRVFAPLGHRALLARAGFAAERVIELDWWQTHALAAGNPATVTCTPAKHWGRRRPGDTNTRLWGGFMLTFPAATDDAPPHPATPPRAPTDSPPASSAESFSPPPAPSPRAPADALAANSPASFSPLPLPPPPLPSAPPPESPRRVYFLGDSGYDAALFRTIGERLGAPDLALIPIGAYEPRWFMRDAHMDPAEAVQTHRDLGARRSLAMHWGTFQLTDEAREAPVTALAAARAAAGLPPEAFPALAPGESLSA